MDTPRRIPALQYELNGDRREVRLTVETVDNHIYFYADVDSDRSLALMREIRELDKTLRAEYISRNMEGMPQTPIWLHIYSFGGDLFSGFSLADQLAAVKSPVYSVIEGICASAGTLISMSCAKRYILPSSFMLIHQLSSLMWGTHEQFKDEMDLQQKAMNRLVEFYVKRSKFSRRKVETALKRDFWMDAETCVANGFADEILR